MWYIVLRRGRVAVVVLGIHPSLPVPRFHVKVSCTKVITYHKGTSKTKTDINRDSINTYAQTIGLVGVAMISIDDDWSALRLKVA